MKRIINPFENLKKEEGYNCFGCSPHNELGLKLQFYDNGEGLTAYWKPSRILEGYPHVVHGGIQSTLLDEIGGWVVYTKCETAGVTLNMNVDFKRPLRITENDVVIKGKVIQQFEKQAVILAEIFDANGELCTEASITYFIYPQQMAIKRYNYPGIEAFYEKS